MYKLILFMIGFSGYTFAVDSGQELEGSAAMDLSEDFSGKERDDLIRESHAASPQIISLDDFKELQFLRARQHLLQECMRNLKFKILDDEGGKRGTKRKADELD